MHVTTILIIQFCTNTEFVCISLTEEGARIELVNMQLYIAYIHACIAIPVVGENEVMIGIGQLSPMVANEFEHSACISQDLEIPHQPHMKPVPKLDPIQEEQLAVKS